MSSTPPQVREDTADGHAPGRTSRTGRFTGRFGTWARRLGRPLALAVAFALAGAALQALDRWQYSGAATGNLALTDTETTDNVIGDVSSGLSKVFSFTPGDTATTGQAAAEVLGGNASSQYTALFSQVQGQAAAQGLTLTTRVVRAGVVRLSGRSAQLLVFLDQVIVRKDRPQPTQAAAQLSVTAQLDAGHWKIVEIHAR